MITKDKYLIATISFIVIAPLVGLGTYFAWDRAASRRKVEARRVEVQRQIKDIERSAQLQAELEKARLEKAGDISNKPAKILPALEKLDSKIEDGIQDHSSARTMEAPAVRTPGPIRFNGASEADPLLKRDVLVPMRSFFLAKTKCESVDSVHTTITASANGAQPPRWSEKWTVYGCGKEMSFKIFFQGTNPSGTDFHVETSV
jgi:hypothetical protein